MTSRILTGAFALLVACAGALCGDQAVTGQGLPPVECVRMLRAARIARMSGDPAVELEALRSAAEAFPNELAATYALLEYHRQHGLPEDELHLLRARMRQRLADGAQPPSAAVLRQITRDPAADGGWLREIAEHIERRLVVPREDGDLLLELLAGLQTRLGDDTGAAAALERLWRRTGDTKIAWTLFELDVRLGRWSEALELMESVAELREAMGTRYADMLLRAGRLDQARAALDPLVAEAEAEGLRFDPTIEGVEDSNLRARSLVLRLEELAWAYRDAGRDAEAAALFRRALDLDPENPKLAAAILHLYATDEEREVHAAGVARSRQEETDPRSLFEQGSQLLAAGDKQAAFDLLARAAPHLPQLEAAWFNLGMAAYGLERWAPAVEALGRAGELNPDRAATFFFRGLSLVHLERCGEAVEALERALALDAARTQAHYYLAGCYRALGRTEAAERHRLLYEAARPR